jgi:hypothetical protein
VRLVLVLLLVPALARAQPGETTAPAPTSEAAAPAPDATAPDSDAVQVTDDAPEPPRDAPPTIPVNQTLRPRGIDDERPRARAWVREVVKLEPPRPLLMAELTPANRFDVLLEASTGVVANLLQAVVGGTYALRRVHHLERVEVFGDIRARVLTELDGSDDEGAAVGNIKLGARYDIPLGEFTIAPTLTTWIPTARGSLDHAGELTEMAGVSDGRAYLRELALGVGSSVALRHHAWFMQLDGGIAFVADHGPQVASFYGAMGMGRQFTRKLALLAEWRHEMFPIDQTLHGVGVGITRGSGDTVMRFRFHPFSVGDVVGAVCAVDILTRLR